MLESESSALTAWRYPYGKSGEPLFNGVNSGTRTHDLQGHNLALYQLSYIHHMVRLEGIEPPTYALEGRCSILLRYRRKYFATV